MKAPKIIEYLMSWLKVEYDESEYRLPDEKIE